MDVLLTVALFVPLMAVLWLANLAHLRRIEGEARSERLLKWLAFGLLAALYAGLLLFGLAMLALWALGRSAAGGEFDRALSAGGLSAAALPRLVLGLWLPSILGLVLLSRPARRLAARAMPLDPANPVHAVALSMSTLVLVNLLVTLALGLRNLAEMMEANSAAGIEYNPAPGLWAQNVTLLAIAFVGVGWLARRSLKGTLNRLGIVAPKWGHAALGLAAGLLMVPLVLLVEALAAGVGLGASADVERLTEQLIGPLTASVPGILTLGLAAALGEESVFRGALQPRFGLLLTSALFALLHSQYGITFSTLVVFVVGLVLGVLRSRANTTAAMIAHAVYNMALGAIAYLGWF